MLDTITGGHFTCAAPMIVGPAEYALFAAAGARVVADGHIHFKGSCMRLSTPMPTLMVTEITPKPGDLPPDGMLLGFPFSTRR